MPQPMPRPYDLRYEPVLRSLDKLEPIAGAEPPATEDSRKAVVCIHGILSSHASCFDDMFRVLKEDTRLSAWELCWYDYDYHESMQSNGKKLARYLSQSFTSADRVVLVCHSMGGLVARFGILASKMPFITKVFLLGTPNLGVFRTHQLGVLATLVLKGTRRAYGIFSRKHGILDLTRIPTLVKEFVESGEGNYSRADHIEYVTVPGMFFDTDQDSWRMVLERWKMIFTRLDLQLAVVSGLPLMGCELKRPHDSIVEAGSNCMIPQGLEVPDTEKTVPIADPIHYPNSYYAHIVHRAACKDSTHVQIQHDERIIRLLCDLIVYGGTVDDWNRKRAASHDIEVRPR